MAFRSFNPFGLRQVEALRGEMNRLLSDFLPEGNMMRGWAAPLPGQPAVNVWDSGEALMLEAELPGIKAEQLDIAVVENELTLRVERPASTNGHATYHRRERPVGGFARVVRLPVPVDASRVSAELHDGVLTVTLPKAEAAKPRKIQVSMAN